MDSWRLSIGGEFIPDIISYNNYFERIRYRAGFFTGTDPRSVQGQQLNFTGLTLGLGLPIIMPRQMVSFVDIGFEFGQYGVKNILTEKYFNFTLGLTLNDNSWFFKRKFN
jgi:tetrahydromethanopterin S-methyltransferase subunit F